MIIDLSLDLSGKDTDNLITNELHQLDRLGKKAFVLKHGPFYAESLVITDTDSNQALEKDTQYKAVRIIPDASLRTGQNVSTIIVITDETLPKQLNVSVDYQALGGPLSSSVEAIQDTLDNIDLGNQAVYWDDIIGLPKAFNPGPHLHDANDIYGLEYVEKAILRLTDSIYIGNDGQFEALLNYIDHQDGIIADQIAIGNEAILAHINDKSNPHDVTKAQVELGNVDNTSDIDKPVSTPQQTALDKKATLNDDVSFDSVTAETYIDNKAPSNVPLEGNIAYRDKDGVIRFCNDPAAVNDWLKMGTPVKTLVNQIISISGKSQVKYDILELLGDDITTYNLDSVQAVALIRDVDPQSPTFTFYVNDSDLVRYGISRINNEVIVRNLYHKRRSFKILITIGRSRSKAMPVITNVFDNATNLAYALEHLKPPSMRDVFEEWHRFSITRDHNSFYETRADCPPTNNGGHSGTVGTTANNAGGWLWSNSKQSVLQPVNTCDINGFISNKKYDTYDHEITLVWGSDWCRNGIVLAHRLDNGKNVVLLLGIGLGRNAGRKTNTFASRLGRYREPHNAFIRYLGWQYPDYHNDLISIFTSEGTHNRLTNAGFQIPLPGRPPYENSPSAASAYYRHPMRIGVQRRGDDFKIFMSDWDQEVFNQNYTFEFNLNDQPWMEQFKGPQSYGYANQSNPNAEYKDIYFNAGERNSELIDLVNNKVYSYIPGQGWVYIDGLTPQGLFGAPRELIDKNKNKNWMLNLDGTWTALY